TGKRDLLYMTKDQEEMANQARDRSKADVRAQGMLQSGRSMTEGKLHSRANEALVTEFIAALAAADKERVLKLISDDWAWLVVPWGYTVSGYEEVTAFLGAAERTRTHEVAEGQHIAINGWFTDGEHLCVEITNIASLSWLKSVKAAQRICLVLHMSD